VKLTDASSESADFDQSLKNEREVSSEGKAEESQKSGSNVENSSSREKPVQSVSHHTRSGSDNGESDQRSELSIFLITLHAPLSTVLTASEAELARRSRTGEGEAFTGCFCPQPTAVITGHRIPSPKIGVRFPVGLPVEPFSIINHT